MKVSVVVPVYNKAPYLEESFNSIFAQTFTDFELIAVDDRSTDDSVAVLRRFADPRLRVVELERNHGPAGAAQRAMDLALGEYIVRMDADDTMYPDRIARQVELMERDPSLGASSGRVQLFGAENGVWAYPTASADCHAELLFGVPVAQGASILRTEVLRRTGVRYLDHWPRIGEDWLFWSALGRHTRFANLDVPLIRYRRGEQNISHGHDPAATRRARVPVVLNELGLYPSPQEVDAHLMATHILPKQVDAVAVRTCHGWIEHLRSWNRTSGFAPQEAMDRRLDRAWSGLFYRLADVSTAAAMEHLRIGRKWPMDRLLYLAKRRAAAAMGRRP